MKLIVGLGNPGLKYKNTRHNLGFQIIDALAKELEIKLGKKYGRAVLGTGRREKVAVVLVKPLTFMNNSGESVGTLMKYYKIEAENLIVICDDLNLDTGRIRIRQSGSSGGHNGLNSIIESIGSGNFVRVRVGIGKPPLNQDPAVYVLKDFARGEKQLIKEAIPVASGAIQAILTEGVATAMNKYNKKES